MNYIQSTTENGIYTLTISRPEALNALNGELIRELSGMIEQIEGDPGVRVVVITGAGRSFVAGADIAEMVHLDTAGGLALGRLGAATFRKIEQLPIPVIAAVNGFALGGGCELALACDIRIASAQAKLGQPEVSLGIPPGFSGTVRLTKLVGPGKAKELIFSGKVIDAQEASRIGLVEQVVPAEELMTTVMALATQIASKAPIAVSKAKAAINHAVDAETDQGIAFENKVFSECFSTDDQKEGMQAFLEKRTPAFKKR